MVVHQVAGTVRTARLLVGQEGQDHVAGRTAALTQALADDGEDHRVHVLHVDGAAAPDAVFLGAGAAGAGAAGACGADVAGERVDLPVRRVGGDDVEVAVDEQGGPGWSSPVMRVTTLARPGRGFQDGRLEADLGEERGDVLGRLALAGAGVVAPVGRIDPDQVAAQAGDLVLSGDVVVARGGWSLRHHPMVAPGWVEVVGWLPSWVAEHPAVRRGCAAGQCATSTFRHCRGMGLPVRAHPLGGCGTGGRLLRRTRQDLLS